jgi:hypothetical protein
MATSSKTSTPGGPVTADQSVTDRYDLIAKLLTGPTSPEAQPVDLSSLEPVDLEALVKGAVGSTWTMSADELAQQLGFTP